jgi:pimeloyl-ACP methyl ester carboxylesterase
VVDRLLSDGTAVPERLSYWGRSLGASFAALLSVERPASALVLQTPIARADRRALAFGAPPFLVKHPLRVDRALLDSRVPTLLLQHTHDTVAPPGDSERLKELRPDAELVRIRAGHNDSGSAAEQAKENAAIVTFLQRVTAG